MKTTILLATFLVFISSVLHAQIDEGKIQIGGSIGAIHQKQKRTQLNPEYKSTYVSVSPSVGKFYRTNKLVGVFLNYDYNEYSNDPYVLRTYGGGIFFRQYIPVINKLYILFNESGGYAYLSGKDYIGSVHGNSASVSVGTGMAYDIKKKMQLELLLNSLAYAGYYKTNRHESYNIGSNLEGNSFSGITLGFRYYLK